MRLAVLLWEGEETVLSKTHDARVRLINLVSHRLASKKSPHENICQEVGLSCGIGLGRGTLGGG